MPERCEALEELRWTPGVPDCDLMMYLRAARSMAAFAGMCDGGSAEDGCLAASRDDTTINALELLHESNYDTVKALQALVKNPIPKGIDKKWTEDEQKRFVKGLRQYGKNFFKIRKELLPHKDTADLVEFYYLWKKTPQAASTRHHRRHRRQSVLRRIRAATTSSPSNSVSKVNTANAGEFMEMSSASEEEDSDDSDSRDISSYSCQHCATTTSKDWHHIGKDKALMCTECRLFFKKHGEMRPLPENSGSDQTQILLKVKEEESVANGKHVMRTRRSKDITSTSNKVNSTCNKLSSKISEPSSPERVDMASNKTGRKSPNGGSGGSSSSSTSKKSLSTDSSPKGKKRIRDEKINTSQDEVDDKQVTAALIKKRKGTEDNRPLSPSESVNTENSVGDSNEEPVAEADAEESIDNGSNPQSPPSPLPTLQNSSNEVQIQSQPAEVTDVAVSEKTEVIDTAEESVCTVTEPSFVSPDMQIKSIVEASTSCAEVPSDTPAASPKIQQPNSAEAEGDEANEAPVNSSRSSPPAFISTCPPLLTPKQEPPSSPIPNEYSGERPLSRNASEPNIVPSLHPSSSPVRVKKEVTSYLPSKSPSQIHAMNRSSSPVSERLPFPFMPPSPLSQPLVNITNTLLPSSQSSNLDPPRNKTPETSDSPSKAAKVSPRSRSPIISSIPLHLSSSLRLSPEINHPQPAYTMAPTLPAEQRLPPVSANSYPSHGHPLPGPLTSTSHGFPYPHILPPQMHPYFAPPHWYTAARSIPPPPPHLGFAAQSLPPSHSISSAPQASPHGPLSTPKSKSPVSSQSSKGLSHSPQTPLPHFGIHNQQSLSTPSGMFHTSQSHRHERNDHSNERNMDKHERHERHEPQEEEEVEHSAFVARGPSPEPKIEDSECHRSQSAIFLRHWNRGDFNSCSRTDLTFKPVPDSQLARKREERARKAAEKEREEQKRLAQEKGLLSHNSLEPSHHLNPFDRHTPRANYTDTPALRQLSEYARPHGAFSPGFQRSLGASLQSSAGPPGLPFGLPPPHGIDPLLQYQIASGMYGPVARERLEMEEREKRERMELEKRERELKEFEMKSRMASLGVVTPGPGNATPGPGVFDPQWFELQRRYAAGMQAGGPSGGSSGPPQFSLYNPSERERLERMSMPPTSSAEALHGLAAAERLHSAFSSGDPLTRLQMANIASELHSHAHTHAHTHAHAHTHLHLHPQDPLSAAAAAAAAMGIPSHNPSLDPAIHSGHPLLPPAFPPGTRPGLMSRADMLHPGLMRPPFDDPLAHQMSQAMHHEQFQRQLYLADRDRLAAAAAAAGAPHPTGLLPQHEEFFRQQQQQQQREREMKLRSLEEAVRGGRPC